MYTVKQWRELGVDLIIGDKLDCNTCQIQENWYIEKYLNDGLADTSCVEFFSPRKNKGVQPVPNGIMVEIEYNKHWNKGANAYEAGSLNWADPLLTKWSPSQYQPLIDGIVKEHKDQLAIHKALAVNVQRQIFTQAMADNGELPPVGSECLAMVDSSKKFKKYVVMYITNCGSMVLRRIESKIDLIVDIDSCEFKPADTRTDREKAIDEMFEDAKVQGSKGAFERLYDAGYRKC